MAACKYPCDIPVSWDNRLKDFREKCSWMHSSSLSCILSFPETKYGLFFNYLFVEIYPPVDTLLISSELKHYDTGI
jgi:hypothetical protein